MSNDPYSPDYEPEYTGTDAYGDVGSGEIFALDLFQLYVAGRVHFPDMAVRTSDALAQVVDTASGLAGLAVANRQPALSALAALTADVVAALHVSARYYGSTGRALVEVADEFAATDEAAAAEFSRLIDESDQIAAVEPR